MRIHSLWLYPMKSGAPVQVPELTLTRRGPVGDREWMIVDAKGTFVTQRSVPSMARMRALWHGRDLLLDHDGAAFEARYQADGPRRSVTVWRDTVDAVDAGDAAAAWVSARLGADLRLVHLAPDHDRPTDHLAPPGSQVSFADGYPLLVVSTASLADLNARLAAPIPMERFRPNIVVEGCEAFDEDRWAQVSAGTTTLTWAKPCARCSITTVDPATGETDGPEPLKTLARYRRDPEHGVLFGANYACSPGVVRLGDPVSIDAWQ